MTTPILLGGAGGRQSIFEVYANAVGHHAPGTPAYLTDGRVFHYCKNTGATPITRSKLIVCATLAANHQNLATTTASMQVGSKVVTGVTLGATAAAENLYADGYLVVVDGGGEGTYYKIREHAAIASAGTGSFTLYDEIAIASDANTEVSLFQCPYVDPVISVTDQADVVVGIPLVTVPDGSTTAQWFWAQSQGPCTAFVNGTPAVGTSLMPDGTTAGHLVALDEVEGTGTANVSPAIGEMLSVGIDDETQFVDLRIRGL